MTDASKDGLGAVVEQKQPDGSTRPLCFLSRSTSDTERRWTATELECGAIIYAIKKNRQLFYGIPFVIITDHQPLKNLESLATKVNRVQRWFDFLSAYTYELIYRPGTANANADMMSRLPLPATVADETDDVRLTDPSEVDVYHIGASGVRPAGIREPLGQSLGGLAEQDTGRTGLSLGGLAAQQDAGANFQVGERKRSMAPLTTDEEARRTWQVIQKARSREVYRTRMFVIRGNTPLTKPVKSLVTGGQLDPGLLLYACPPTEECKTCWVLMRSNQ